MPITNPWVRFSEGLVDMEKDSAGVYEMGNDAGTVVYIGISDRVRAALREHFSEAAATSVRSYATQYRVEYSSECVDRGLELYDEHVLVYGTDPQCM